MLVEQVWTANAYRNFNYLIACPETGEALAVDPLDHKRCLKAAKDKGWQITQILNTHEHGDHTGGNKAMIKATGASLLAHANAKGKIPDIDRGLGAGDVIKVGATVELEALDTPGHTMSHVCLLSRTDTPALFCGDTLFNAGAGNCHSGGHPAELYETFAGQLARLPDETLIYPGHDYIENNLGNSPWTESPTTSERRPCSTRWGRRTPTTPWSRRSRWRRRSTPSSACTAPRSSHACARPSPISRTIPGPREVFLKLRELRNSW